MEHGVITLVNCTDEAPHEASAYLKWRFGNDKTRVDVTQVPAPAEILANAKAYPREVEYIKKGIAMSVKNGSRVVVVAAHDGCRCNFVTKKKHLAQLGRSVDTLNFLKGEIGFEEAYGIWIDNAGEARELNSMRSEIAEMEAPLKFAANAQRSISPEYVALMRMHMKPGQLFFLDDLL